MRYDTNVRFVYVPRGEYDETTGDYADGEPVITERLASVEETRTELINMVYGKLVQGSITAHLQNHYDDPISYVLIDGKKYTVDYSGKYRVKSYFVLSEAQ